MKILFISRSTLFKDKGGDSIQIIQTANELRKLGVEVDIRLTNESIDYSNYDLIHFFNIIRPADILPHLSRFRKPYAVSTIYVDYSEYEKKARSGATGWIFKAFSSDQVEYLKTLARAVKSGEKIRSLYYIFSGQRKSIRKILQGASLLFPNSENEYRRLESDYGIKQKYKVVPNGIDPNTFNAGIKPSEKNADFVLCVARIEGRKNQLNLIRAVANSNYKLVLIGSAATNQSSYYNECLREASANIKFIRFIEQEELLQFYRQAKVHVLPSWFETTGLSSLEAAAMGCNVVITRKGDAPEYFGDLAYYCEPDSPESIRQAIDRAATEAVKPDLAEMVIEKYNWKKAAEKTKEGYLEMLSTR